MKRMFQVWMKRDEWIMIGFFYSSKEAEEELKKYLTAAVTDSKIVRVKVL